MSIKELKSQLENRENAIFKFDDVPRNDYTDGPYPESVTAPGFLEPTTDVFLARMTENQIMMDNSVVKTMNTNTMDLDEILLEVELDGQRTATGVSGVLPGGDSTRTAVGSEIEPIFRRKYLTAEPYVAFANVSENFLEENIEKESFMDTFTNLLTEKAGPAFERVTIYGKRGSVSGTSTGYGMNDGILQQLEDISNDAAIDAEGFGDDIDNSDILTGIENLITTYIEQDGITAGAVLYVSSSVEFKLRKEIKNRQTELGDNFLIENNTIYIYGIEVVYDSNLNKPKNGWETDVKSYVILTQPQNIIYGMMKDVQLRMDWELRNMSYLVALTVKGDVKIGFDQDTIAARVVVTP